MPEFELIDQLFTGLGANRRDVVLGVGDDAAIVNVAQQERLVTSLDTLVEGVHFLPTASARSTAHRVFMSNVSDMAAMGATPQWCLLSISLPQGKADALDVPTGDVRWIDVFSSTLSSLLASENMSLIGGDTTSSPVLSISLTMMGAVPLGRSLRRSGAQVGDDVYVSGWLGEASAGLSLHESSLASHQPLRQRFFFPTARTDLGCDLIGVANSCIDVSDGLLSEARHIANASQCAIEIELDQLLLSDALDALDVSVDDKMRHVVSGGDDYELLFTAAESQRHAVEELSKRHGLPLTRIGSVYELEATRQPIRCVNAQGELVTFESTGFQHAL